MDASSSNSQISMPRSLAGYAHSKGEPFKFEAHFDSFYKQRKYPIAFLLYMPDQIPAHLKVMYTRPVVNLVTAFYLPPMSTPATWMIAERAGCAASLLIR